jgi:hypothetical protein
MPASFERQRSAGRLYSVRAMRSAFFGAACDATGRRRQTGPPPV